MSEDAFVAIVVSALGLFGVVLAAAIPAAFVAMSKLRAAAVDSAAARSASERAESSMNNSPHTVTERLASIMAAQDDQGKVLVEVREKQETHTKDIRGVREDIGILQGADRSLRADLTDHLETSAKVVRTVNETSRTLDRILPDIERLTQTPTT